MSSKRILITGLIMSGKTTFARRLQKLLKCPVINGDFFPSCDQKDKDIKKARLKHVKYIKQLCNIPSHDAEYEYIIGDFNCLTQEERKLFNPFYTVFLNTRKYIPYENTDIVFEPPVLFRDCDMIVEAKEFIANSADVAYSNILKQKEG